MAFQIGIINVDENVYFLIGHSHLRQTLLLPVNLLGTPGAKFGCLDAIIFVLLPGTNLKKRKENPPLKTRGKCSFRGGCKSNFHITVVGLEVILVQRTYVIEEFLKC